ncbi:MAG TPA: DUF2520 domain-containing protein [Thermoleophilaceae bacterium]|nr:DUF2520 domain-containing protein [Thermoleophilaceae bacterium]
MSEPVTSRVPHATALSPASIGVVGRGRAGTALAAALRTAGLEVDGPTGRGEGPSGEALLLCVPDSEIPAAAATVARASNARLVGHVSGATPLSALAPAGAAGAELFGLHPLQTLSGPEAPSLAGAGCAVAGSTPYATATAAALARRLGMRPFEVDDARRASYHAAASIASNFLVTLEGAAEAVAGEAGFGPEEARALLAPLVRRTVENWAARGPEHALTGPVARGDEHTVTVQRAAVAGADPALVPLFDALVERTRALAARSRAGDDVSTAPRRAAGSGPDEATARSPLGAAA